MCLAAIGLAAVAVPAAQAQRAGSARGKLLLRVGGVPSGQRVAISVSGPPQAPHRGRLHRRLRLRSPRQTLSLAPGRYRLTVGKLRIERSQGAVKRGATAFPARRHLRVTVRAGRTRTLEVLYDSIVNPGVRDVGGSVARVLGDPQRPSAVLLRPGVRVRHGQILSAAPSAELPKGLLARAVSVSGGRRQQVVLRAASIYEVAPNFSFDVPVTVTEGASASQVIKCESNAGVDPFVHLDSFRVSGGWTTSRIGFIEIKTGATAELHFHAAAGLNITTPGGVSCALKLPALGFQGMAGPIPVYGAVRPGASIDVGAAATLRPEISTDVAIGARASAVPPRATPILDFSSPNAKLSASVVAGVKAGLSLSAELGVGAINAANLHVDLTNSLGFSASPGQCSWDLDLGAFSATGEVGPLSISTPSSPAIHKNLWQGACGSPPAPPPAPAPAPSPSPTPSPTPAPAPVAPGPLVRAAMYWETDADVDLYAWDEFGNLLYFGERDGIPAAELVEDVIPFEGEVVHPPEVFQETALFNRAYTFGICDFRRFGGEVALVVTDPGGSTRVFRETLLEAGEGVVITTSPVGAGFQPEPGWCRFVEDE
ncbi:MAG: hypothetical protein AB7F97_08160 [Solirubrobacterales bacterium]